MQQQKAAPPDQQRSLERAARQFVALWCRSQDTVAAHIPPSQLRAMETVREHPEISQRELSRHLAATPSSASRLCDRLEAAGLLSRTPNDNDRRQVTLRLTPEGAQILNDLERQRHQDLAAVLNRMSSAERDHLLLGMAAFADHARTAIR